MRHTSGGRHDWSRAWVSEVNAALGIDDQIIGRYERFAVIAVGQHLPSRVNARPLACLTHKGPARAAISVV
jgi:hypothetical protein